MDNLTPEQRKKNMKHIRSKDTAIEIKLRKALWRKGYRYRKNPKNLPGKPDIALTKYKIAVFCEEVQKENPLKVLNFSRFHIFAFSFRGATSTIILYFPYSLKEKNNL